MAKKTKKNYSDSDERNNSLEQRLNGIYERFARHPSSPMNTGYRPRTPEAPNPYINQNVGYGAAIVSNDNIYKAQIPEFFYKPAFGLPLMKNVPEIRRMASTPTIVMVINTIIAEISELEWDIEGRKDENIPKEIIEATRQFFYHPNSNNQPFSYILKQLVRDSCEVDAGVLVKIFNLKGEFTEVMAYDGALFTKNPNVYGVLPEQNAFFQYGWTMGVRPIPFDRAEVIYMIRNPRTDTVYGRSEVENCFDTLQLLAYGIDSNLEYYTDNAIPKGIISLLGASGQDVKGIADNLSDIMKKRDNGGNFRRYYHKIPVVNSDVKFERIPFSNLELELIAQQQWFTKLVWACYGITPSELGFTETSNRATDVVQSSIFKRKVLSPYISFLEYYFNREIVNDLPWIKGSFEDKVFFKFKTENLGLELNKREVIWGDLQHNLITINEAREKIGMPELDSSQVGIETTDLLAGPLQEENLEKDEENKEYDSEKEKADEKEFENENDKVEGKATGETANMRGYEFLPEIPEKEFANHLLNWYGTIKKNIQFEVNNSYKKVQRKAIDLEKLTQYFTIDDLKPILEKFYRNSYLTGLERVEKETNRNYFPDTTSLNDINDYNYRNMLDQSTKIASQVKAIVKDHLLHGTNTKAELNKKISSVLKAEQEKILVSGKAQLRYAQNKGYIQAYKDSQLKGKMTWVSKCSHAMCQAIHGTEVKMNEKFQPLHSECTCGLEWVAL